MSRPGWTGSTALWIAKTASASANRATAERRVPTQASKECHAEASRGRVTVTTDTGA